jgi:hypothetical protein
MSPSRLSPLLLAASIATAACTEAPPPEAPPTQPATPEPAKLIATLTLEEGHTLQFWDASSAAILVAEDGPANQQSSMKKMANRPATAPELYRALAPGREVPASLIEAQSRVDAFERSHPKRSGAPKADEGIRQAVNVGAGDQIAPPGTPGANDTLCPETFFRQNYCAPYDNHYYGVGCSTFRANGGYTSAEYDDVTQTNSAVCTYRGTATFRAWHRTWWSWNSIPAASVPAGRAHWVFTFDRLFDYDYQEAIDRADGIGYHRSLYLCTSGFNCPF